MKVLVADPFETSGLDALKAAGCEVVYQPDLTGDTLADAIRSTGADVLVVRSLDRTRVYDLGSTQPIVRPVGLAADRMVTFGEPRRGGPPQITAWYPQNETLGRAFVYPAR